MDVETPAVYGYGQVLAKAVRDKKVPESVLDRSVRRVLRDKFALGLFENPYVSENPAEIHNVSAEGVELSKRLAAASVTLLKNDKGLLPLSRDIAKIAIIGPHADDVEAGFTTYMYANVLKMYHARATGGDIAMAGVGLGAPPPPEAKAALAAEMGAAFKVDRREYLKSNYAAMSYTTFEYSPLKLPSENVDVSGELRASLTVTNTGKRPGTEVVQLYAADTATGVTLPAQQLVGFTRVDLEPGASKSVTFGVPISLLAYTGLSGVLVIEPGPVEVSAGSSSSDTWSTAKFTITGKTRVVKREDRAYLSVATVGS
jgi:hypothetical protein